jgi:hypothetical protein
MVVADETVAKREHAVVADAAAEATASPRLLLTVTLLPVIVLLRIVATAQPSDGLAQLSSPPMWIPPVSAWVSTLFGSAVVSCALLLLIRLPSIISVRPLFVMPPPSADWPFGAVATAWLSVTTLSWSVRLPKARSRMPPPSASLVSPRAGSTRLPVTSVWSSVSVPSFEIPAPAGRCDRVDRTARRDPVVADHAVPDRHGRAGRRPSGARDVDPTASRDIRRQVAERDATGHRDAVDRDGRLTGGERDADRDHPAAVLDDRRTGPLADQLQALVDREATVVGRRRDLNRVARTSSGDRGRDLTERAATRTHLHTRRPRTPDPNTRKQQARAHADKGSTSTMLHHFLPLPPTLTKERPATAVLVLPHKLVQRQRDVNGRQAFVEPKCGVGLPKWTGPRTAWAVPATGANLDFSAPTTAATRANRRNRDVIRPPVDPARAGTDPPWSEPRVARPESWKGCLWMSIAMYSTRDLGRTIVFAGRLRDEANGTASACCEGRA